MPADHATIKRIERQLLGHGTGRPPIIQAIWRDIVDKLLTNIEAGCDAPGDIRLGGSIQDKIVMALWLYPAGLEDDRLLLELRVNPGQPVTIQPEARAYAFRLMVENVLEQMAGFDELPGCSPVFIDRCRQREGSVAVKVLSAVPA